MDQRNDLLLKIQNHNQRCGRVAADSPLVGECQNNQALLQGEIQKYRQAVNEFNQVVKQEMALARNHLETRIQELRNQIRLDQEAIRHLGLAKRAEDFEEWEKLAQEAKTEFESHALKALIDLAIEAVPHGSKIAGEKILSLEWSPEDGVRLIKFLESKGVHEPFLLEAIRHAGTLSKSDKQKMVEGTHRVLVRLSKTAEVMAVAKTNVNEEPLGRDEKLAGISHVLQFALKDPTLKILAADVEFTTFAVYNHAARRLSEREIKHLTTLTENQLHDLKRLSEVMKKHVAELNRAQGQRSALADR